jgi:hypothetical protein
MVLAFLLSRLLAGLAVNLEEKQVPFATLYTWPPDDWLQMSPKHVEMWQCNKMKK